MNPISTILTAIVAMAPIHSDQAKCYMVNSRGETVDLGNLCQNDSSTPVRSYPVTTQSPQPTSSRVNPNYPESFYVTEAYNVRAMVYGTLWNNTDYTIRNVRVRAYVGCDAPWTPGQEHSYGGIFAPGSKIEIPVYVRAMADQSCLNAARMDIVDYDYN